MTKENHNYQLIATIGGFEGVSDNTAKQSMYTVLFVLCGKMKCVPYSMWRVQWVSSV